MSAQWDASSFHPSITRNRALGWPSFSSLDLDRGRCLTIDEIARSLSLSREAVKGRLHLARGLIREYLTG